MLVLVAVLGLIGIVLTLREWAWLFVGGIWCFMALIPAVEAAEQTVIQRVVPYETQGRVFGLAMTFAASAAPVTSFLVAPIAEFLVVPYMATPTGKERWMFLIGAGSTRGFALIFIVAGLAMVVLGLAAMSTRSYRRLSREFRASARLGEVAGWRWLPI